MLLHDSKEWIILMAFPLPFSFLSVLPHLNLLLYLTDSVWSFLFLVRSVVVFSHNTWKVWRSECSWVLCHLVGASAVYQGVRGKCYQIHVCCFIAKIWVGFIRLYSFSQELQGICLSPTREKKTALNAKYRVLNPCTVPSNKNDHDALSYERITNNQSYLF